jgi:RNA polymerase sigma factor (sigma-70 family)
LTPGNYHHSWREGNALMADLDTSSLLDLAARFRAGDNGALDILIRRTEQRLQQFARRQLQAFPGVGAREQSDDVLQNSLIRLTRALRQEKPATVQDFLNLAGIQIRRELLDLARHHARRPTVPLAMEPTNRDSTQWSELERWTVLHDAAEHLPGELRDVFSYSFYQGWTQLEIAELLGISDRQVRRLWVEACLKLKAAIGDLPDR